MVASELSERKRRRRRRRRKPEVSLRGRKQKGEVGKLKAAVAVPRGQEGMGGVGFTAFGCLPETLSHASCIPFCNKNQTKQKGKLENEYPLGF